MNRHPLNIIKLLSLVFIVLGLCLSGLTPSVAQAQDSSESVQQEAKQEAKQTKVDIRPNPTLAANNNFDSEKEERLENLRYKHLWIAYSLVWIIIFVFIRQTWQRSQAVSSRLEELKSRLIALEEKDK